MASPAVNTQSSSDAKYIHQQQTSQDVSPDVQLEASQVPVDGNNPLRLLAVSTPMSIQPDHDLSLDHSSSLPPQYVPQATIAQYPSSPLPSPAPTPIPHSNSQEGSIRGSLPGSSWTKFRIPTKTSSLSSGFPYDERLHSLRVSNEEWFQFSSAIIKASKLTLKEDWGAWTTGITMGILSSSILLVFAPWGGIWAGKKVHRKRVENSVSEKLSGDGELRRILRMWNRNYFLKKGFLAWLELPENAKKGSNKFQILICPSDGMEVPGLTPLEMDEIVPGVVEADGSGGLIGELNGDGISRSPVRATYGRNEDIKAIPPVTQYPNSQVGEIKHELE